MVERHQRERVATAVSQLLSEHGYASLTVELLQKKAGISRSTFYVLFANKRDAVLSAYNFVFGRFVNSLADANADQEDRSQRIKAAISMALQFASTEPEQAHLLSGFALCADPALARRVFDSQDQLAAVICESQSAGPQGNPPGVGAQALVAAITSILARHLIVGKGEAIRDLETRLVKLALSPYLGPEEAEAAAKGTS